MTTGHVPNLAVLVPALQEAGDELARVAADAVRLHAPVDKSDHPSRTPGTFRDSIQGHSTSTGDGVEITVVSDDEIAGIIIGGSRPHGIDAVQGYLRFWTSDGVIHFARHVDHPGTPPHDVGGDSASDVLDTVLPYITDALEAALAQ